MAIEVRGLAPLLSVFDMPTAIAFYRDILGFTVDATSQPGPKFDWAMLSLNCVQLMLNTAYDEDQRPSAPDPRIIAAHHDTCIYFACPDVDAAYSYLRERGINVPVPKVAYYGMKQLYVSDPDGYHLCFQWRAAQQVAEH